MEYVLDWFALGLIGVVSGVLGIIYYAIVIGKNLEDLDTNETAIYAGSGAVMFFSLFVVLQGSVFEFGSFVEMSILFLWITIWIFTLVSCSYSVWMSKDIGALGRSVMVYLFFSLIPFVLFPGSTKKLSENISPLANDVILNLIPSWPIIPYLDALVIYSLVIVMIILPRLLFDGEFRKELRENFLKID